MSRSEYDSIPALDAEERGFPTAAPAQLRSKSWLSQNAFHITLAVATLALVFYLGVSFGSSASPAAAPSVSLFASSSSESKEPYPLLVPYTATADDIRMVAYEKIDFIRHHRHDKYKKYADSLLNYWTGFADRDQAVFVKAFGEHGVYYDFEHPLGLKGAETAVVIQKSMPDSGFDVYKVQFDSQLPPRYVFLEYTWRGHFTGKLPGMKAPVENQPISLQGVDVIEFGPEGYFGRVRGIQDSGEFLMQVGALPRPSKEEHKEFDKTAERKPADIKP